MQCDKGWGCSSESVILSCSGFQNHPQTNRGVPKATASPPPGSAYQGWAITSRKQGPHFSLLLCARQSCHARRESAFIRTTTEHFYIDILIGGSLATINNRPPRLIISESTEKSQVRVSFPMTHRERKERVLLQSHRQSQGSITCESQIFHTEVPTLGDCSTGNCFSIFHLPEKSCQEISTQTKNYWIVKFTKWLCLPRAADV